MRANRFKHCDDRAFEPWATDPRQESSHHRPQDIANTDALLVEEASVWIVNRVLAGVGRGAQIDGRNHVAVLTETDVVAGH